MSQDLKKRRLPIGSNWKLQPPGAASTVTGARRAASSIAGFA